MALRILTIIGFFNHTDIQAHILNYFQTFIKHLILFPFCTFNLYHISHALISQQDFNSLIPVTLQELHHALFHMPPHKALGPDGLHVFFFQKFWTKTNGKLFQIISDAFNLFILPSEINQTFLTLIPKINNADFASHYRPISLCNTSYKLITKIMSLRIKPF